MTGRSMWPLLRPGMRVYFRPVDGCPPLGAILLYDAAGQIVVHRLMRLDRSSDRMLLVTKGDLSPRLDVPIELGRALGEVIAVPYGRFVLPVANPVARRIGWLLAIGAQHLRGALRSVSSWLRFPRRMRRRPSGRG